MGDEKRPAKKYSGQKVLLDTKQAVVVMVCVECVGGGKRGTVGGGVKRK